MGIHMDVNMPSRSIRKSKCVFYALVLGVCCQSIAATQQANAQQGYTESGRQSFSGIVERLSQDATSAPARQLRGGTRPVEPADVDGGRPFPSQRLRVAEDDVVALRPQPMSVRQTSYESAPAEPRAEPRFAVSDDGGSREALDRLNAQEHLQSFIERESAAPPGGDKIDPAEMVSRIGVNLLFVLALAVGGILLFKQLQKSKGSGSPETPAGLNGLKIDQVLQVSRGVSLYLVDSAASKVLVAVDGGGIKSVNVLPPRFADTLDQPDAFAAAADAEPEAEQPAPSREARRVGRHRVDETSSSEIDQNLIKLLLSKSKQAA
jgi:flagellar biogenesis protein FliO